MLNIALSSASIIFFCAYLVFTTYIYKKENGETYLFRNSFPFELWIKRSRPYAFINILLFTSCALGFASYLTFSINEFSVNNTLISFYALVGIFGVLTLFYIPPYKLKAFLIFAIITSIAGAALNFQMIFIIFKDLEFKESVMFYIVLILSLILGIVSLLGSFFVKVEDLKMLKDETGSLIRPKRIAMAIFEWLIILSIFLSQLSLVLYILG